MKKIVNAAYVFAFILLSTGVVSAQGKVNFSGKWKINESKSKLNEQYSSHPSEITITQSGNNLTVERISNMRGNEMKFTDHYTLDGKECRNPGFRDSETVSTAKWSADGKAITINTKISTDNGDMTMARVLKMDGNSLVMDFTINGSFGESSETWVFDKE